jgi:hypothetical protein
MQVNMTFKLVYISENMLETNQVLNCKTKWFSFDMNLSRIRGHPMRQLSMMDHGQSIMIHASMTQALLVNKNYDSTVKKDLVVVYTQSFVLANPTNETIHLTHLSTTSYKHEHDMNLSVKLLVKEQDVTLPKVEEALTHVWTFYPHQEKRIGVLQITNHYSEWKQHLLFESAKRGIHTLGFVNVRTNSTDPVLSQFSIPVSLNFTKGKEELSSYYHARQWLDFGTFIYPNVSTEPIDTSSPISPLQKRSREITLLFHSQYDLANADFAIATDEADPYYMGPSDRHIQVVLLSAQRRDSVHNERCIRNQQQSVANVANVNVIQFGTTKCTTCVCTTTLPTLATVGVASFTAPMDLSSNNTNLKIIPGKDEITVNGKFKLLIWKEQNRASIPLEMFIYYKARVVFGRLDYKMNQTVFHVATDLRLQKDIVPNSAESLSLTWDGIQDESQFYSRDIYLVNRFPHPIQFYHATITKPVSITNTINPQTDTGYYREHASPLATSVGLATMYQFDINEFNNGVIVNPGERKLVLRLKMFRLRSDKEKTSKKEQQRYLPFMMKKNLVDQMVKYTTSVILHTNVSRLYVPLHVIAHPISQVNLSFVAVDGLVNPTLYGSHVTKKDIHLGIMNPGTTKSHLFVLVNEQTDYVLEVSGWEIVNHNTPHGSRSEHDEFTLSVVTIYKVSSTDPQCKEDSEQCHDDSSTRFANNGSLPIQLDPNYRALMKLTIHSSSNITHQHAYNGTLLIRYKIYPNMDHILAHGQSTFESAATLNPPAFNKLLQIPLQYYVLNGNITFKQTEFDLGSTFRGPAGIQLKQPLIIDENNLGNGGVSNVCVNFTRAVSTDSRFAVDLNKLCIKSGVTIGTVVFDPRKRNFKDYSTLHLNEDPYDYMSLTTTISKAHEITAPVAMRTAKVSMSTAKSSDDMMTMMDDDDFDDLQLGLNSGDILDELDSLLSEEEENDELVASLVKRCKRLKKYTELPDYQKLVEATVTLETNISRKYTVDVKAELIVPKLHFFMRKAKDVPSLETIRVGLTRVGTSRDLYVKIKNPSTKPIRIQRILIGDASLATLLSQYGRNDTGPVDESKIRDKWDELLFNTTTKGSKESETREKEFTLSRKRLGVGVIIPGHSEWNLGPISYTPKTIHRTDAYVYVMNNLTFVDWISFSGVGGTGRLVFSAPPDMSNVNMNDTAALENHHARSFLPVDSLQWSIKENSIGKWENGVFVSKQAEVNPNQPISFTTKFSFSNNGNLKIVIWDVNINGRGCEVYGLRLHKCKEYSRKNGLQSQANMRTLHPGQRSVMKMTFTPDFTTSEVNLTIHFTVQSVMQNPVPGHTAEDPIDYVTLPLHITLPRTTLPNLHAHQRRTWNTVPVLHLDDIEEAVSVSAVTIIVTNVIWVIRWMITGIVFFAAVYVASVTLREWFMIDFGLIFRGDSKIDSSVVSVETQPISDTVKSKSGSKSGTKTEVHVPEKLVASPEVKAKEEITQLLKNAEVDSVVTPVEDAGVADSVAIPVSEVIESVSAPHTPEITQEHTQGRRRSISESDAYNKPKPKASKKQQDNYKKKGGSTAQKLTVKQIIPTDVPKQSGTPPLSPQPEQKRPQPTQVITVLKRKTSGGKSSSSETTPPKVPERILLRTNQSADGTPKAVLKKIKQPQYGETTGNEGFPVSHSPTKKDRSKQKKFDKHATTADNTSSSNNNDEILIKPLPYEKTDDVENAALEEVSPSDTNQNKHVDRFVGEEEEPLPEWYRPSVSAPESPSRAATRSTSPPSQDQQENVLFQRWTQAFQPRQEPPGYFSLFSGAANTNVVGGNTWSNNNNMGMPNTGALNNAFMNPFGAGAMAGGLGAFDPLGYGSFGSLGSVARERTGFINQNDSNFGSRSHSSLFSSTGNHNSFFSSSPSRFSFITPMRSEFDKELNDFELEQGSNSSTSSSPKLDDGLNEDLE